MKFSYGKSIMADKANSRRWISSMTIAFLFCAVPLLVNAQDVVGKMGTQEIKGADLKRLLEAFPLEARKRMAALDRLVREELVRQFIVGEAKRQGWDKKPDVQLAMDRARD